MPIYEYLCEGCGRITEVMQKVSDPPPRTCAECGSRKIAKLVSRTSFQLKGGGWYSDLYASKKAAKPADGASTASGAGSDPAPSEKASPSGGAAGAGAAKPTSASPAKTASAPPATKAPRPAKRARGGSGD